MKLNLIKEPAKAPFFYYLFEKNTYYIYLLIKTKIKRRKK